MTEARPAAATPFGADDGATDPALAALLAAHASGAVGLEEVQAALLGARLLVPVVVPPPGVALPDDGGGCGDGVGALAGVTLAMADGRRAQPAFTGLPALAAWDPAARPLPHAAPALARAVLGGGVRALLVDPAGPVPLVLDGGPLRALAEGRRWRPPATDPEVAEAVVQALTGVRGLVRVRLRPGEGCDLTVELTPAAGLGPSDVRTLAQECARRVAGDPLVGSRAPAGVDVALLGPAAP